MPRIRAANIAEHKVRTRAAILDAAIEALASRDFDSVSLGVVADYAGLPRSTLYDYFDSREALVAALIEERVPPLMDEWLALLPDGGPLERLEGFFDATFTMAARHPELTSALLGAGRRIPRAQHREYVPIAFAMTDLVRSIVDDGISQGVMMDVDPAALAEALTDVLAGGIDDIVGRDRDRIAVATVTRTRLDLVVRGILRTSDSR